MTIALIDGDIVAYRCAASCEPTKNKPEREPLEFAIGRADEQIYRILHAITPDQHRIFIGGSENFRKALDPNYKAHRVQPKPVWLDPVRNFLFERWQGEVCAGYEADDGIGIAASDDTVICSIDKDLRQIPGRHYNFIKDEHSEVGFEEALWNFYCQMLTGDSSDNVKGIDGVGPVRARRILDGVLPKDMESCVHDCYRDAGISDDTYFLNYRLLRIVRSQKELEEIETAIREGKRPELTEASRFVHPEQVPGADSE